MIDRRGFEYEPSILEYCWNDELSEGENCQIIDYWLALATRLKDEGLECHRFSE